MHTKAVWQSNEWVPCTAGDKHCLCGEVQAHFTALQILELESFTASNTLSKLRAELQLQPHKPHSPSPPQTDRHSDTQTFTCMLQLQRKSTNSIEASLHRKGVFWTRIESAATSFFCTFFDKPRHPASTTAASKERMHECIHACTPLQLTACHAFKLPRTPCSTSHCSTHACFTAGCFRCRQPRAAVVSPTCLLLYPCLA